MEDDSTPPEKIKFTAKESQIIPLILEGKSTELIASQPGVSTRAVEYHLTDIYKKMGVCSRTEAVIKLFRLFEE